MLRFFQSLFVVILIVSIQSVVPAAANKPNSGDKMYLFDMTSTMKSNISAEDARKKLFDEMHLVAAIQGLANRKESKLYVYAIGNDSEVDKYWLNELQKPGEWLNGTNFIKIDTIESLVKTFKNYYKGVVLYDPNLWATSNVASTVAGADNLLPVRYDPTPGSMYNRLVAGGLKLPVKVSLLNNDFTSMFTGKGIIPGTKIKSTGSAKCDAYIWAKVNYLDTGKCDAKWLGYYLDSYWIKMGEGLGAENSTMMNHDFIITHKGFVFDLAPWGDETPVDDPHQPVGTDLKTLQDILLSAYNRVGKRDMVCISGFFCWALKYTKHAGGKHDDVPGEWEFCRIISTYNAYLDADAIGIGGMANASFYRHYPLKNKYPQNSWPTLDDLKAKGYVDSNGKVVDKYYYTFYVGDYDSSAWLYHMLKTIWNDPNRGKIPLGWAFNPTLEERFPVGMVYARKFKTPNDYFIAGDSGGGYINPGNLTEPREFSGLPSGWDVWVKHNKKYFGRWDLSITGFIIDGYAKGIEDIGKKAYSQFSQGGIVAQKIEESGVYEGMPFIRMGLDLSKTPQMTDTAKAIRGSFSGKAPEFRIFRTILWTPTDHLTLINKVRELYQTDNLEFVDPFTFFSLIKLSGSSHAVRHLKDGEVLECTPSASKGISVIYVDDGKVITETAKDTLCWKVGKNNGEYLYFSVEPDYIYNTKGTVNVKITYLDEGSGAFSIQYDSRKEPYQVTKYVNLTNSDTWKTATFILDDVKFADRQNGFADLRICTRTETNLVTDTLYVSKVEIMK